MTDAELFEAFLMLDSAWKTEGSPCGRGGTILVQNSRLFKTVYITEEIESNFVKIFIHFLASRCHPDKAFTMFYFFFTILRW